MNALLEVRNLKLEFKTARGWLQALTGVSFAVQKGEIYGLVGETGCGKTVTGLSILRLLPQSAHIPTGEIVFDGVDLLGLSRGEMERVRGGKIAMIFQDPSSSLNPVFTVGSQIERVIRRHRPAAAHDAHRQALQALEAVGLPDVARIHRSYPHQLSGGQQQRVMIAMALSCQPSLLIADEPTTALDMTIQAQILKLLTGLRQQYNLSVILITHNLGVVAHTCDRLSVLYAGKVVESGPTGRIFEGPQHPYTRGLMAAIPQPGKRGQRMEAIPGSVPSNPGGLEGCPFWPRCASAMDRCQLENPILFETGLDHYSACFLNQETPHLPGRIEV